MLRAYEYRCCVCGFDLRIGNISAGLEAAHIQWFTADGPDVESNGMAMCSLHHKIFDLGAFTVEPANLSIVFSQNLQLGDATRSNLLSYHGAGIIRPPAWRKATCSTANGWARARQRVRASSTDIITTPRKALIFRHLSGSVKCL